MTRPILLAFSALTLFLTAACGPSDHGVAGTATEGAVFQRVSDAPQPGSQQDAEQRHASDHHQRHEAMDASAPLSDRSLYHLDATWTTHRGDELALVSFRGAPTVIVMLYANCETACPILIRDALRLEETLTAEAREHAQFVMVTIDPARDAPENLAAYVRENELDAPNWHFLSGSPAQTRALAALLGVQYRDAGNGMFSHSNLITVLDPEGVVALRTEGLGQPVEPAVQAIGEMGAEGR